MTLAYKRRKIAIKQLKADLQKAGTFPVSTFNKDFAAHLKNVIQPQWRNPPKAEELKSEEQNEV